MFGDLAGILHSGRGAMVDLSHESGPKSEAGVVVPDSTSPGFDRIWDRDGSGPRFDPGQDSPLLLT